MGKRGPKPKELISNHWSAKLAYAIGLLATDGCLIPPSQIDITSKDREQLLNFCRCVETDFHIGEKKSGEGRKHLRIQFKNVLFYEFLASIGLMPAKSKILGAVAIPEEYFWDFLRGVYDGDGSVHAYRDLRWSASYMFYTIFASASERFTTWLRDEIFRRTSARGHVTHVRGMYQLKYAKRESLIVLRKMYRTKCKINLSRKELKIRAILRTIGEKL